MKLLLDESNLQPSPLLAYKSQNETIKSEVSYDASLLYQLINGIVRTNLRICQKQENHATSGIKYSTLT